MKEDFYGILGINERASQEEIRKAYRGLQMKWHPDKNPGNQEAIIMTQKLNEAYEVLSDEQKRQEYDMMKNNPNPFIRMNSQFGNNNMDVPIDEIFNMFFGGGPFMGMPNGAKIHVFHGGPMGINQALQKPIPIIKTIEINMVQVLSGTTMPLEIERWILENGNKVYEKEIIYVDVPQGIDEGEMIILRDKGHIINEHIKGDVKLNVKINNNSIFKRQGLDLILEKNISLKEALCGFSFEIIYLNGKSYTLNNQKGNIIPPEYKKVYQGMGLTRGDHKGNMIIHFHIDFPEKLTTEQIDKLKDIF